MSLKIEYLSSSPKFDKNLALAHGFDASSVAWSEDEHVRNEINRLLGFAKVNKEVGAKAFQDVDLSNETPFDLSTAIFEDIDFTGLTLPKGTNFCNAHFIGCNVSYVNLDDCILE